MAQEPPILIWTPGGGVSSPPVWPPATNLTYPECGRTQLVSGQGYIDVVFSNPKPDANWIFTDLQVVNTVDAGPFNIAPGIVTDKTITGFRLQLNGLPNTNNYYLNWSVGGCGTSDWVVQSGVTEFLRLTDTPDDYVGQSGKAVKVNVAEDGLEFGPVSGGDAGVINVLDYGAVADCVTLFDITMPNGNVVTSAGHTFVSGDVGKWAIIRGATGAGVSPLVGKITAVSGHTATLDVATTSALTNLDGATSFPRMDFGTDNTIPFVNACRAVPGPGQRNNDLGTPFSGTGVYNPILAGDGGTVYIPRGNYLVINGFPGFPASTFWFIETNNITIKGDGMGQSVIFQTSDSRCTMPLWGGFVGSHGLFRNWIISDLTFYDLNYYNGSGNSLDIRGASNVRIERIEICNSRGNGGINYQGYAASPGAVPTTNRLYIRDCWVHGITEDGYGISFPHSIEGDGMNVGEMRDVHIENNTIEGTGRHGYEGGGTCQDQYFVGNTIDMMSGGASGINATGGSTTVIMGNTVKNILNYFGIDCTVDVGTYVANNIRVIGNSVSGTCQAGFRFQNSSGDLTFAHVTRIILANNWVESSANPSEVGVTVGGGGSDAMWMLIEGNWFGNTSLIFNTVNPLPVSGTHIIIKNNVCAGYPLDVIASEAANPGIIAEGNVTLTSINRYGSYWTCGIDSQTILAGATYSNASTMLGALTTDSVEIVRGATTAGGLIIWGQVTAANTVTTYAYNPTGGSLGTGATCKFIVHRPISA